MNISYNAKQWVQSSHRKFYGTSWALKGETS